MDGYDFDIAGETLTALPSGALWFRRKRALAVSDLHLCKSERIARQEGRLTPPYETRETLTRLAAVVEASGPVTVICLGDSFDDVQAAASLDERSRGDIARLMAGRRWIWIAGNHDPAPANLGGSHVAELRLGALTFRHMAEPAAEAEISGHYHPKVRLRGRRPCFLVDRRRAVLPAFGVYTGGLDISDQAFAPLFGDDALALITGRKVIPAPWRSYRQRRGVDRERLAAG